MQESFENVKLTCKANVYYDGKITSRTFHLPSGERKTLGVFLPGEYEFGTGDAEIMEVLQGSADVLLPGASDWKKVTAGDSFSIPANSKFQLKNGEVFDYICSYIKD
ncbi:MAG: pyrimidine/purine nucleoside phosphorylase [Synergistota bacterium]|nr:pyrimidine/purine nucleoside phosphorylase [Synergistota bacterium]